MGFDLHTIGMPPGAGPYFLDRLVIGSFLNIPFPAAAAGLGTVGSVTAGSGYTFTPTVLPTGGVVTAASAAGVPVTAVGWQAVLHATMKVVGTPAVVNGGTGYVTNDTVLFANGVELTVTASGGVVSSLAVTAAGSITQPGPLPTASGPVLSTSGVGVGLTATFSWGIGAVLIDDSGNYGTIPTGFSVTSVDGNGTAGAVASGLAVAAGKPLFRQVVCGGPPAPNFGIQVTVTPLLANPAMIASLQNKVNGFVTVRVEPCIAANSVTAGTFDALMWA